MSMLFRRTGGLEIDSRVWLFVSPEIFLKKADSSSISTFAVGREADGPTAALLGLSPREKTTCDS
jgi:hypothetical protein